MSRVEARQDGRDWTLADLARPIRLSTFTGHTGAVLAVAYGSGVLATASADNTVEVLDTADPTRITRTATLVGHTGPVVAVAVHSDSMIVSAGADGTVRRWELDPNRVANLLCRNADGNLSAEQWEARLPGIPYRPPCP
ncbi:WD40 repeat domain-containing protein [Actinophytocola sp.]|uniref:WD40 repeat domain-containing protein n=1 Tax=Actinophytocola sp. TaxID=1872138 RepID=UPI0039C87230